MDASSFTKSGAGSDLQALRPRSQGAATPTLTAVRHRHAHHDRGAAFFGHASYRELRVAKPTPLDCTTLAQRLNSASYVPQADALGYGPMTAALRWLCDATQRVGRVARVHETRLFCRDVTG